MRHIWCDLLAFLDGKNDKTINYVVYVSDGVVRIKSADEAFEQGNLFLNHCWRCGRNKLYQGSNVALSRWR